MIESNKIYFQDCIALMKQMESNSVDLIIADPPYNLKKILATKATIGIVLKNGLVGANNG